MEQTADQTSAGLLRSCKTVMLATFIDCYCHEIYSGLGEGTPEEIAEAWNEIVSEWSGLMKNEDADYIFDLVKRISSLKSHLAFVQYATYYLEEKYDLEVIATLINEFGYAGEYPEDDREVYLNQLSMVNSLSKTYLYALVELQEEYDRLQSNGKGEKLDEERFEKDILRLSKYQGYRIDKFRTSVFEYAHIHNNFIEEIKLANKNNRSSDI